MLLLKSEAILTVKCQIGLSIKRSLMSSLSAMAVCYIHGCLEFLWFPYFFWKKKKVGQSVGRLCPRFPELMHCLSIFLLDLIICVQHHYCARNQEGQHNAFKFRHSIQMSLALRSSEWWNLSPSYYYSVNPQVWWFLYLFTSPPDENGKPPAPPPPLKKDKIILCTGVTLTQFPMWRCKTY